MIANYDELRSLKEEQLRLYHEIIRLKEILVGQTEFEKRLSSSLINTLRKEIIQIQKNIIRSIARQTDHSSLTLNLPNELCLSFSSTLFN